MGKMGNTCFTSSFWTERMCCGWEMVGIVAQHGLTFSWSSFSCWLKPRSYWQSMAYFFSFFFLPIHSLFSLLSQLQCTRRQLRGKGASGQEVHRRSLWWFSAEITAWVTANKLEKADIIRGRRRVHMLAEGLKLLLGCQGRGIGEPSSLAVPGAGSCEQCCIPLGPVQAGDKKHSLL